jgi:hypothetical protein
LCHGDQPASERRPQADEQQARGTRRYHFRSDRGWRRKRRQTCIDKWKAGYDAQEHQAGSGQPARKCGEESLHRSPLREGIVLSARAPASKAVERYPPFGALSDVDDAAFQADRDGMRSIVCAQLRENVFDVAFDGLLGDGEVSGDYLVGVAARDESEHLDFAH